jgi:TnsA endonuclease N terminal
VNPPSRGDRTSILQEEPRCSNVIFVGHAAPAEPLRLDRLQRAREPVSRSKSGIQGKVADVIHGRSRHAESQNELRGFQVLMATGRAEAWQEQPFVLEYHDGETRHRYTPDLLVSWRSQREVVEIKDDREAESPENQRRFALIGEILAEHDYSFRVWRRSEICAEPRLTNSNLILRYRCIAGSTTERERIRRAFFSTTELPLRELCGISEVSVQSVLRLVLAGVIHIDWWEPLGLDSRVSIAPVGRQIWPCPPEGTTCH